VMATREDIVEEARSWLGVKWRDKGRSRRGIDCAGLPVLVGIKLGLTTYDNTSYPSRPDGSFVEVFRKHLIAIPVTSARDGDVLLFQSRGSLCHCGIRVSVDGVPGVVHAYMLRRKVVEETLAQAVEPLGKPRFAFQFPGIEG